MASIIDGIRGDFINKVRDGFILKNGIGEYVVTVSAQIESQMLKICGEMEKDLKDIDARRWLQQQAVKAYNAINAIDEKIEKITNIELIPDNYGCRIGYTDNCRTKLNKLKCFDGISATFMKTFTKAGMCDEDAALDILKKHGVALGSRWVKTIADVNTGTVTFVDGDGDTETINVGVPDEPVRVVDDTPRTWEYKIQRGDTLSALAKKYNTTVEELCRLNGITNPNLIIAGASLLIPMVTGDPTGGSNNESGQAATSVGKANENESTTSGINYSDNVGKTIASIKNADGTYTVYYGKGNISHNCGYTGQCTWYAYGRFYEVTGIKLPTARHAMFWLSDNASNSKVSVLYGGESITYPAIAVRTTGKYGHVLFVENVTYNEMGKPETVYYTECNNDSNGSYDAGKDCVLKQMSYSQFIESKKPAGYIVPK